VTALAILDLGYGNVKSVALAFERLGTMPILTDDPVEAEAAERLVLPGVGAAGTAMQKLRQRQLDRAIVRRSNPTLGICLGMQLLFEESEEDGGTPLLGILEGRVAAIPAAPGFPVPHMGWSRLESAGGNGLATEDYVYFAHSYACPDGGATTARAIYGDMPITAAIRAGPLWGAQFHPERSSAAGARFLKAFLDS
jgi:glutamine amidotransferase